MPRCIGWNGPTEPSVIVNGRVEPATDEMEFAMAQDAMLLSLSTEQAEELLAKAEHERATAASPARSG